MSTVVDFPREKLPSGPRADYGPAQIFIFTGVRYERLEYVPPQVVARKKAVRQGTADIPFQG